MRFRIACCFLSLFVLVTGTAKADEVTDWNRIMVDALLVPPAVAPPFAQRPAAIVQAAVFDAVNGIEQRYYPIHVVPAAVPGASKRAAVVQAAYASLVHLFPSQTATFDQRRADSLLAIASGPAAEHSESIERGIQWGQTVADEIWKWRSTDGSSTVLPPFLGGTNPGQWRPTPPANAPGAAPQIATEMPWVIEKPSQFRPAGPPSLSSIQYANDLNETKLLGSLSSSSRTADQSLYATFWQQGATPVDLWDPLATSLSAEHHLTLSENARLLALVNLALADAQIGCWDAKYFYASWRPVTAIQLADFDGNPGTIGDPNWTPFLVTPGHPEYPSAHSCISSAGLRIMSNYFGENTQFNVVSDGMPGVTRYFSTFSSALDEVGNARIFGGMHFRTAVNDGRTLGTAVGDYILANALLPIHGEHQGQVQH